MMDEHGFSGSRFLVALFVLALSALFFIEPVQKNIIFEPVRMIDELWHTNIEAFITVSKPILLVVLVIVNAFFLIRAFRAPNFYCSDCGQFLGQKGCTCPRCGCNIYSKGSSGVGQTHRDGGKNY